MTCPDWSALEHRRLEPDFEETAAWREALAHVAVCPACRRIALAQDPALAFVGCRDLSVEPAEVEELRRATQELRRLRALEAAPARGAGRRAAMAAGLALAGLLLLPASPRGPVAEPPALGRSAAPAAPAAIENLDRPGARIYQWRAPDLAVVLVVDESLDF